MVCASGGNYPIRALSIAKKEMGLKNFRMLFAGKGQDEEKLAALVKQEGLTEEMDLFLFPSLYDANSLEQIEAACQGTPTVFHRDETRPPPILCYS